MYIQTCWQCAAKNEISDEEGAARAHACSECGAVLPTAGAPVKEDLWPVRGRAAARPASALSRGLSELPLSYVLIAVNALFFALMVARGVHPLEPTTESILYWGADFGPATLGREPWRLLTSMFMHIGVIHLALNMYVLSSVGPMAEELYGKTGFLVLYLLSGVGGSLGSIIWTPAVVSAGASGAVFGLFGGLLGVFLTQKSSFHPDLAHAHITRILFFLAFNIFYGLTQPAINNAAHMGGLATGFLTAVAMRPEVGARRKWKARQLGGVAVVLLALGAAWYAARQRVAASPEAQARALMLSPRKFVAQPGREVYYFGGATADDAQALAGALEAAGFFEGPVGVQILLSKGAQGYEASIYERPDLLADAGRLKSWGVLATDISADSFAGQPFAVHLCDESYNTQKTVRSGSKSAFGPKAAVYFWEDVTAEEAAALARALQALGHGRSEKGAYVELSKNVRGYVVSFLLEEGAWDDPRVVELYREEAAELSAKVFGGRPVTVRLMGEGYAEKKTFNS